MDRLTTRACVVIAAALPGGATHAAPRATDTSAVTTAIQLGAGPEVLAAGGLDVTMATAFLTAIDQATVARAAVAAAELAADQVVSQCLALDASLAENPGDEAILLQRESLDRELVATNALIAARRQALLEEAIAPLSATSKGRIRAIVANSHLRLPLALRAAAEVTAADLRRLEAAVVAERRNAAVGTSVPSEDAMVLATFRAKEEVAASERDLAANLSALTTVFTNWGSN